MLNDGIKIDEFIARLKPNLLNHDKNYPAGDFRSTECIELLKQADIVVTNPPFSLFREYVAQLVEYDKKFVIIGHQNAITYKEIFKLIKDNQIWLGCFSMSKDMVFAVPPENAHLVNPKDKEKAEKLGYKGNFTRLGNSCWFTNLPHKKRNEILETIYNYDPQKYPKYDNYDAINVDKTLEIPMDYEGVMGVPITFLDKYNPMQFEIVGQMVTTKIDEFNFGYPYINGKKIYARILIRRKK
ncbi:adenine-specific methyltransferase EcoRI family protein [Campylobacter majalis]|uniref:adenine-specific methyltransferase EcoRI family protein n=1 Tax=Campylobacter majalis TaxID=2790656 RepID=UPI003D694F58